MQPPDTITIEVKQSEEIPADGVDLHVSIKGKSFFTGQQALTKAAEVNALVAGLIGIGVAEADIFLQDVHADVSSGIIGRSSSATYRLRICCRQLEALVDVLDVVTSQPNTILARMEWKYAKAELKWAELLDGCLGKSKHKAGRVASTLGVALLGLHSLHETASDSELDVTPLQMAPAAKGSVRPGRSLGEELGVSLSHGKHLTLTLTAQYRISPFTSPNQEA